MFTNCGHSGTILANTIFHNLLRYFKKLLFFLFIQRYNEVEIGVFKLQMDSTRSTSMTREDFIKATIASNGYTLKDFAKRIQMPYTTLLSILNGSIGGAGLDNVLKICRALNIKIEDLNRVTGTNDSEVQNEEDVDIDAHLLEVIRNMPPEKRTALKILLTGW